MCLGCSCCLMLILLGGWREADDYVRLVIGLCQAGVMFGQPHLEPAATCKSNWKPNKRFWKLALHLFC